MRLYLSAILLMLLSFRHFAGEETPAIEVRAFRGDGTGRFSNAAVPSKWSETKNVNWIAKLGTTSYASPVVLGARAYVLCEPNVLYAVSLADGKTLWTQAIEAKDLPEAEREKVKAEIGESGVAAPTPVTDGTHLYVVLGNGLLAAYDLDGKRKWLRFVDQPMTLEHGRSASPLLVGGKLIVTLAWTLALDPADGKTVWENKDARCSYGSPAAARVGNADVIFTPGGLVLNAADGKIVARRLGSNTNAAPLVQDGVVYYVENDCVAYKLPEKFEDPLKLEKLWEGESLEGDTFGTPLLHDGLLHSVTGDGNYHVIDAKTGKLVFKKETELTAEPGAENYVYASPTLAGKRLYLTNTAGVTLVLEPGREFKQLAKNNLNVGSGASPVCTAKFILLRGEGCLYAIGE